MTESSNNETPAYCIKHCDVETAKGASFVALEINVHYPGPALSGLAQFIEAAFRDTVMVLPTAAAKDRTVLHIKSGPAAQTKKLPHSEALAISLRDAFDPFESAEVTFDPPLEAYELPPLRTAETPIQ